MEANHLISVTNVLLITTASFATQQGTVREDAGTVQVCVNVSNANNIPAEGANVTVFVAAQASTATRKGIHEQEWCSQGKYMVEYGSCDTRLSNQ